MSMPNGDTPTLDNASAGGNLDASGATAPSVTSTDALDSSSSGDGGPASPEGSGVRHNPAWDAILEVIPTQFHPVIEPKLKEWDRSYGELAKNYSKYKQFDSGNIPIEDLQQAHQLYRLAQDSPQELLRRLQSALGVSAVPQSQQQDQQQQNPPTASYEEDSEGTENNDPRIDQLQQQLQALQQQQQQVQQKELEEQYATRINHEIESLKKRHGDFDVNDVLGRFMAQMQRGEEPSIAKAFAEQQTFINNIIAKQKMAPEVVPPSGGLPPTGEKISVKTPDDRVAAIKAMIAASEQ